MTLLSIILSLLIEQAKPLAGARVDGWLGRWGHFLEGQFNAGERHHGVAAWVVGCLLPALVVLAAYWALVMAKGLMAAAFSVAMLYLTTGFRQFSHYFTDIHLALRMGELARARQLLQEWQGGDTSHYHSEEVARLAIEEALLSSHRHVYAPFFWFFVFGPAGALLYRLARFFCYRWTADREPEFGDFARRAFAIIDWVPVRLTAAAFAVVGDFEDAVACWRTQAARWPEQASGILLATGAGALGVRLGMPLHSGDPALRPELGVGDEADADFMQSTIGLVWRTLVMALLLLALLGIVSWAGH